ncbi:MAG TPA: DinB family protein [Gemmatimonadaceae bacterium]|nr:DinB family protein [Gemmatimonadaceae bacterium]
MEIVRADTFLPYFENIRARTIRVASLIPPDRVEWTHRAGAFTLGDLVRHIAATERWMFAENVRGRASRYPGHGRELADGFEAVLAYLSRMHEESMLIFRDLTPEQLQRSITTPAGTPITAWKWLRAMVEHEVHHRGQLYLMLSMLGIKAPPIYGLTSEQVHERSVHD